MIKTNSQSSMTCLILIGVISLSSGFTPSIKSSLCIPLATLFAVQPEKNKPETIGFSGYTTDRDYSQYLSETSSFRRFKLFRRQREDEPGDEDEDGYAQMMTKKRSILRKAIKFPFRLIKRIVDPPGEPGTLILVRHGESIWNANKTFTGWADPDLSTQGYRESEHAARLLLEGGYQIDVVFTSRLKRAIRSSWIILQEMNLQYMPVFKSWRLNERMYGT